ncbi:MAG: hypothetical protein NVV63_03635 [Opitutus sp.]|nr:hypothetical protein [Opitutus sp.]
MPLAPSARARLHATAACAGSWLLWWRFEHPALIVLAGVFTSFAVVAWISPRHHAPVQRMFDRVLHALLAVFSWIVLALVFALVFVPLRVLLPRARRRLLRPELREGSYFQKPPPPRADRFSHQF